MLGEIAVFLTANGADCFVFTSSCTTCVSVFAFCGYCTAYRASDIGCAVAVICVGNMISENAIFISQIADLSTTANKVIRCFIGTSRLGA